jgi:protein gp37
MADKTGISWTDATWNPIAGCSRVSPGCVNCYAENEARRLGEKLKLGKYADLKQWGGRVATSGGRDLDGRTWDEMP